MVTRLAMGHDFFHTHPMTEEQLNLDKNHVIIDKKEYEEVLEFLRENQIIFLEWRKGNKIDLVSWR